MSKFTIAIQEDNLQLSSGRYQSFSTRWNQLALQQGIATKQIDIYSNSKNYFEQLNGCHAFMWWFGQPIPLNNPGKCIISSLAQITNIPTFPNLNTIWHFDNKVAQHYLLSATNIPIPKTWVFWWRKQAEEFISSAQFPLVLKLASGITSRNVVLINNIREAKRYCRELLNSGMHNLPTSNSAYNVLAQRFREAYRILFSRKSNEEFHKGYLLFQEFLSGNDFDIRVTVIGKRAFAFKRYNRPNDFRASGSGRIDWNPEQIPEDVILLAFETSRKINTQSLAVDILRRDGKPVIAEISYYYEGWAVEACPGHWELNSDSNYRLSWVEGSLKPEDAIWNDFISEINNKAITK